MKKPIIILGSSRKEGNTWDAVTHFTDKNQSDIVNLAEHSISSFDYEYNNKDDDFLKIAEDMASRETIILATPIYWYMPSGIMKVFIDRFTDLITHRKDIGNQLRGKKLGIICSYSSHPDGKGCFEDIFISIAKYLHFDYRGCYFYYCGKNEDVQNGNKDRFAEFYNRVTK